MITTTTAPGAARVETHPTPRPGVRTFSWALSKAASAELRITGDALFQAEADRLRQYIELTVKAVLDEGTGA